MKNFCNKSGFTLIEIILIIFLASLFLGIGLFISSGRHYVSDVLRTETDSVIAFLREAQLSAMFGVSGAEYFSLHFEADSVFVNYPLHEELVLDGVQITDISLNGGGNEIRFLRGLGIANPSGSVTLTGPAALTRTINILPSGLISSAP